MTSPETNASAAASGGKWRSLLSATAAVAAIAAASVVIVQNLPPRPWFPATPPPPAPAPPPKPAMPYDPHPGDFRSPFAIIRPKDGGAATLAIGRAVGASEVESLKQIDPALLHRELVRQAFLMAARDARGMNTRDELLDDQTLPADVAASAEISSLFQRSGTRLVVRSRPEADAKGEGEGEEKPLLFAKLGEHMETDDYPFRLAAILEELSRTELPTMLDRLGIRGKPNPTLDAAPIPEGVESKLGTLGLVDHFEALRDLHRSLRSDGESPERLGALARAYAQLAALTAHHWSASYWAFHARALLYAQRMVARDSGSPRSLRNRALVGALLGFHALALKDLADAAKADAKDAGEAPPWVAVIEAALKYDEKGLDGAPVPYDRLAAFLRMRSLSRPDWNCRYIAAAGEVVRLDPDCAAAYDAICEGGGLGDLHKATVLGPQSFQLFLRKKLESTRDLPAPVRTSLERAADDRALTDAMDEAGRPGVDAEEPSWGVLGHLARETRFAQVRRRIAFMVDKWRVPAAEFWAEARPLVEKHPYRPYLGAMAGSPEELEALTRLVEDFDRSDLEAKEVQFMDFLERAGLEQTRGLNWTVAIRHATSTADDIAHVLSRMPPALRPKLARDLLEASPYSPYARAELVEHDWERSQDRLEEWKRECGDSVTFLWPLAEKLMELQRYGEARPLLERHIALSADRWPYEMLAKCCEQAGDVDGWRRTLDEFLEKTEDNGLNHAEVQVKLARYYLKQGEPAKAKPYADEAARTWASWAMVCAAEVDERLGDLDSAEAWRQRTALRYPNTWQGWYLFCRRTGRGNFEASQAIAKAFMRRPQTDHALPMLFAWLEGEPDQAVRTLESWLEERQTAEAAVPLVVLYDQTGSDEKRDALLGRIVAGEFSDVRPQTLAICRLFRDALAAPDGAVDLAAVDAQIESLLPISPGWQRLMIARFLLDRKKPVDARKYLVACSGDELASEWFRALAATWLREAFPDEKTPQRDEPKPAPPAGAERTRT